MILAIPKEFGKPFYHILVQAVSDSTQNVTIYDYMNAHINPYRDLLNAHNVPPAGYDQSLSDQLLNNGA